MKTIIRHFFILLSVICVTFQLQAQDGDKERQYLFDGDIRLSGFGGPLLEFSSVNGEFGVSTGGGGALLINQSFFLGGYGFGLSNDVQVSATDDRTIDLGHGGFWLGGIIKPVNLLHLGVSTRLGWGSINFNDDSASAESVSDQIFVVTPNIELEVNMARWFKINIGAGYRIVAGVDKNSVLSSSDLNSGTLTLGFLFGGFGG